MVSALTSQFPQTEKINLSNAQQLVTTDPLDGYPLHLLYMHDILDRINHQYRIVNRSSTRRKRQRHLL